MSWNPGYENKQQYSQATTCDSMRIDFGGSVPPASSLSLRFINISKKEQ